jgi:hypothetical protein
MSQIISKSGTMQTTGQRALIFSGSSVDDYLILSLINILIALNYSVHTGIVSSKSTFLIPYCSVSVQWILMYLRTYISVLYLCIRKEREIFNFGVIINYSQPVFEVFF